MWNETPAPPAGGDVVLEAEGLTSTSRCVAPGGRR